MHTRRVAGVAWASVSTRTSPLKVARSETPPVLTHGGFDGRCLVVPLTQAGQPAAGGADRNGTVGGPRTAVEIFSLLAFGASSSFGPEDSAEVVRAFTGRRGGRGRGPCVAAGCWRTVGRYAGRGCDHRCLPRGAYPTSTVRTRTDLAWRLAGDGIRRGIALPAHRGHGIRRIRAVRDPVDDDPASIQLPEVHDPPPLRGDWTSGPTVTVDVAPPKGRPDLPR